MANICDTQYKITNEEGWNTEKFEEVKKYIEENIAYDSEIHYSDGEGITDFEDMDTIEFELSTKWNVRTEEIQELAKKFNVSIVAIGRENGLEFIQCVKVDTHGIITYDEELDIA